MSDDSAFEWGGYSEIDVDSVDLELFPLIKEVHYSKVTMNKGDCIFMPGGELKLSIKCSIMVVSVNSLILVILKTLFYLLTKLIQEY